MRTITLLQPKRIVFGRGCASDCGQDLAAEGFRRILLVTAPPTADLAGPLIEALRGSGATVAVNESITTEPTIEMFEGLLQAARAEKPDVIIGLGGGSALDAAKLTAALLDSEQNIRDVFGVNLLAGRNTRLVCLPTTAGTGSEVSPNAILLDRAEGLKKGVVSPHVVPDVAYIDPLLTRTMPPEVTAATGMDALTHCIEAYANRFAHPIVDLYTLEGVRLIGTNLSLAVAHGDDVEAREKVALASLYGGLCLGPVNTAAVHALSYPLGGEFHVAHGLSNAVLLPYVLAHNLPAAPQRYAEIALALGAEPCDSPLDTAGKGVERIHQLLRECGLAQSLSQLGIPKEAIPRMAAAAMKVTRLLRNNLKELTAEDAESIYRAACA